MCSDYYTSVEVLCALALGSLVAACTLATLHVNGLAWWPGGQVAHEQGLLEENSNGVTLSPSHSQVY